MRKRKKLNLDVEIRKLSRSIIKGQYSGVTRRPPCPRGP